jgi:DNA invertase Pin-like site-specific DNA recombinase
VARKPKIEAVAYLRTSSATNVGPEKDSEHRQDRAISAFAKRAGFEVVGRFYDEAVSGADPIQGRPGFAALLDRIENNGVRTVIVEDASRFARELMTQELGIALLIQRGVKLLTAGGDDLLVKCSAPFDKLQAISGELADRGHVNERGRPFHHKSIRAML